jgi:Mg-chelatase subunit ChlD
MRALILSAAVVALAAPFAFAGDSPEGNPQPPKQGKAPRVEVVFCLDTTGSMTGLLDGAKKKIWSIATEILAGKPKPDVFLGLVAYRDKGDEYVTKVSPLTDDLDKIYKDLQGLRADGGGDIPEHVRAGLNDALTKIQWSSDSSTLKIIFLVGDAPAHTDYTDTPTVEELCTTAVKNNVIINTVRCGPDEDTARMWQKIARLSEGRYFSIAEDGGVVAVATPFDKELGALNDKLAGTMVAYGAETTRAGALARETASAAMSADDKADRACAKAYAGKYSSDDLVDAVKGGSVALDKLQADEMPDEMKKMTVEERKAFVAAKAKEREELRQKVVELARKRDAYLAEESRKRGEHDGFDKVAVEALNEQAKKKGFEISCK